MLGARLLLPTLLIAATCGTLNAAGAAYLAGLGPSYEESAARRRADEARGQAFWRGGGGYLPSPEMPWHLHEGERELAAQRDVRHAIELALVLVGIAEEIHDAAEEDAGATSAAASDAGASD